MYLYFLDSNRKWHLVRPYPIKRAEFSRVALKDLSERIPDFVSHYQRYWTDDREWTWMDFGSHTEFYVYREAAA